MEVLLKLLIIFSVILLISVLPVGVRASECDNPKSGWYFYSCWDYATGTSQIALEDGVQPTAKWHNYDKCSECDVAGPGSLPAGAPDGGNALRIQWSASEGATCAYGGINNYVSQGIDSTNPFYERFYFYTTDPTAATAADDSFCWGYKFGRYGGNACHNTAMYVRSDSPSGPSRIMIKNHGAGEEDYNTRTALHLTGTGDWPGKESTGVITPNVWHSYEYAVYRHDTEGWIKAWLDGKLVINASGSAFDPVTNAAVSTGGSGTYDTHKTMMIDGVEVECNEAEIQIPGFRNGGGNPAHTEYIKNLVVSTSYIGPIGTPSQTCAEAGGTCKTNACSSYQSCSSLSGTCSSGYCCSGSCIQDTTPPSISSVSASFITSNSATVTWTTNEASDSQVEYGLTTSYGSQTALNTAMVTSHSQSLSGLSSSTTYHYRVKSRDAAGNPAASGDYTFTTASPPICGNSQCESGETCSNCPQDCLLSGQVCCSGVAYSGNCCSSSDCISPQTCTNHVCMQSPASQISVDSTYPGYSTSVIDDSIINATGGTSTTWASNDDSTQPHWITVTFPSQTQITYANIWWAYNGYQGKLMTSQRVDVQYWNGSDYVTAANILYPGLDVANSSADFPAVSTTSLRFYQPANMGPPTYSRVLWITEIDYGYLSASCIHESDTDCNSCVDNPELFAFIDRWKVNNQDVTLKELIEAIGLWKRGC